LLLYIGGDYTVEDLNKDLKDCKKTINMYISSGGGSVFSGWAMMSALERTNAHITAHIDGIAAFIVCFSCFASVVVRHHFVYFPQKIYCFFDFVLVAPCDCAGNCTLIANNQFKYKNIPTDKISEMKKQVQDIADSDQDSKQIQNSLTNDEIDNMIFWLV
jgi:hypothetical protein